MLEITEGAIMDEPEAAVRLLSALRGHGFRVAIDDFGTGHSSLAYLRDLPVTALKIDKSFVNDVSSNPDAVAIASSILSLAGAVGLDVIAEGVESREQLGALRALGCEAAQGWLWSRAVPASALVDQGLGQARFDVSLAAAVAPVARPVLEVHNKHGLQRLLDLQRQGASLATIAAALNRDGYRTPTSARWHVTSVARVVAALAASDQPHQADGQH